MKNVNTEVNVDTAADRAAIKAEMERLRAENNRLLTQQRTGNAGLVRVSDKGACSFYHGGKFPVTLYPGQWLFLLDNADKIRAFITANESKFAVKPVK